jgi:hypothetical protein
VEISAVPVQATPNTKFILPEKRSAPVIPRYSVVPEWPGGGEVSEQPVRQVLVPFRMEMSGGERHGREFHHRGLKDWGEILLQPGTGDRIHPADGNECDLQAFCHARGSAFIRLITILKTAFFYRQLIFDFIFAL